MFEIHFISINEQGSLRKMCMLLENRLLILIPLELFVVVWSLLFISSNYGTGTHTSLAFSYVALGSSDQVNAKKKCFGNWIETSACGLYHQPSMDLAIIVCPFHRSLRVFRLKVFLDFELFGFGRFGWR